MRILIYGSTYLTALVVRELKHHFDIVGYIPSRNPTFPGKMPVPLTHEGMPHDIKLSIQYDRRIEDYMNAYNVHTGLLPLYGGCDILYHTIKNGENEQGLTFHKIVEQFDGGGILSKISYPVYAGDTAADLYRRMCAIAPKFVVASLHLLQKVDTSKLKAYEPTLYKRGAVEDKVMYERDKQLICDFAK